VQDPVLILGASGGIGGAIARRLARQGSGVILHGRRRDRLDALAGEIGPAAAVETADLTDEAEAAALFARLAAAHTALSGLVFSVATPFTKRLTHRTGWGEFDRQIATQLKALHLCAAGAFPLLAGQAATTRMVVVSSEYAIGMPPVKTASYAAAKAAITAYARVVAQEWLGRGIRVHIVAPGMVRTEFTADIPDAWLDDHVARLPEQRLTTAEDVAEMVAFLMTDAADCLYGSPLQVSRAERR